MNPRNVMRDSKGRFAPVPKYQSGENITENRVIILSSEIHALKQAEKLLGNNTYNAIKNKEALRDVRRQLRTKRAEMKRLRKQAQGRLI